MIELRMRNTFGQLSGLEPKVKEDLRQLLSYEIQGAYFAKQRRPGWDGRIYLLKANGTFPAGLYSIVAKYFLDNCIRYDYFDDRIVPPINPDIQIRIPDELTPRPYQLEAQDIASAKNCRGVFLVGTGGGKTLIAAMTIDKIKAKTIFITPDLDLKTQTFNVFDSLFPKQVSTDIFSDYPIVIANIQSLQKLPEGTLDRFQCLVVDELHHSAAKSYLKVNAETQNAYYRYGFTGTFTRTDGKILTMLGVISDLLYEKTTSDLIHEGFLVPPKIIFYEYQTTNLHRTNYKIAYDQIIEDEKFNRLIGLIASKKIADGKQVLILVRRIEHGENITKYIKDAINLNGSMDNNYRDEIKKAFNNKEIKCVVATSIFGEGTDIPSVDVLINARLQKTEIQTKQGIGRVLRKAEGKEYASVFDFYMLGQKHFLKHSKERLKSYKSEEAFKIEIRKIK